MKKEQVALLDKIETLQKNQLYLMEQPQTIQQKFLHLFAHRHLLAQKMIHKKLDTCLNLLPGSFAQSSLRLSYTSMCIENRIQPPEEGSDLLNLISSWISFYPTIRNKKKIRLGEIVLQENLSSDDIQGYDLYLHYLNLISFDVWKLLTGGNNQEQFLKQKPFKEELQLYKNLSYNHLDASDLLTFLSSCIPKTLLNIVLDKPSLPVQMRAKFKSFECLYANEEVQYYLRTNQKLPLLLKSIMMILLQLQLSLPLAKLLMLLAMRYYYVFHFNRRYSAAELVVYAYNKLTEDLRRTLADDFSLFFKIIIKLGKQKFTNFLGQNSVFLKTLIEAVRKKPTIGYPQQSASPYNTIGIGEKLLVERGKSVVRYFEVLQQCSIFYYRLVIQNMDLNVKLWYLGQIGSNQESKTLLLNQEKKSGSVKNCINAMRKGIYMFEFDNTYSWINSKTIRFEIVIYAPLEIKTINNDEWISDFYNNIFQNQIANLDNIYLVKNLKPAAPKQISQNQATLSRGNETFTLFISSPKASYQYETDNVARMEAKIKQVRESQLDLHFTIDGKALGNEKEIDVFLRGEPEKNQEQVKKSTEKIDYYEEEEEQGGKKEQSQEEEGQQESEEDVNEVIEKEMEQSTIINDNKKGLDKALEQKNTRPKNQISYTVEEDGDFYDEQG